MEMEAYIDYVYVMLVALFCCLLPYQVQKRTSVILFLFMMLMCGFRAYDVGVDTHNYVDYARLSDISRYKFGPVYPLLKQIAVLFPNNETTFLMLMAILTYFPLMYISFKFSDYPALSVLMYIIPVGIFFNESFNIARQSIAIIYVLLATVMVERQRKKSALGLIVIAFLFHPYTFISIVVIFLDKLRLTRGRVNVLLLVSVIIGLIGTLSGIQEFLNILMIATQDNSSELVAKLGKYGDGYDIESGFSVVGQLSHILPLLGLCVLGANEESLNNTYYKMMFIGCVMTNIFVSVIFCERIASTYTIAQLLAVPYIYKTSTVFTRRLILLLIIGTAFLYVYNLKDYSHLPDWTPYHSVFSEE